MHAAPPPLPHHSSSFSCSDRKHGNWRCEVVGGKRLLNNTRGRRSEGGQIASPSINTHPYLPTTWYMTEHAFALYGHSQYSHLRSCHRRRRRAASRRKNPVPPSRTGFGESSIARSRDVASVGDQLHATLKSNSCRTLYSYGT